MSKLTSYFLHLTSKKGFSLVEVLIYTAIIGMVGSFFVGILFTVTRVQKQQTSSPKKSGEQSQTRSHKLHLNFPHGFWPTPTTNPISNSIASIIPISLRKIPQKPAHSWRSIRTSARKSLK